MVLPRPDRSPSLAAAAAFLACALVSGGFSLAASAAEEHPPELGARTLQIVLQAPPEPVIAPRPPMAVLPADASHEFDLADYRRQIAELRRQAAIRASLYAPPTDQGWSEAWREPLYPVVSIDPYEAPF